MTLRSRLLSSLSGAVTVFGTVFVHLEILRSTAHLRAEDETLLLLSAVFAMTAAAVLMTSRPVLWLTAPAVLTAALILFNREEALEEAYRYCLRLYRVPMLKPVMKLALGQTPGTEELEYGLGGPAYFWIPLFAAALSGLLLILFLSRVRGVLWYTAFDLLFFAAVSVFMSAMPPLMPTVLFAALHTALVLCSLLLEKSSDSAGAVLLGLLIPGLLFAGGIRAVLTLYERPEFADRIVTGSVELWRDAAGRLNARRNGSRHGTGSGGGDGGGSSPSRQQLDAVQSVPIGAFDWNRYADRADLTMGPRRPMDTTVMEVYSDLPRTLYLRGVSYGLYQTDGWRQSAAKVSDGEKPISVFSPSLFLTDSPPEEQLRIRMADASALVWLPYTATELPQGASAAEDSYVVSDPLSQYTVLFAPGKPFAPISWEYRTMVFSIYLQVPDRTRAALSDIVSRFDPADPNLVFRVADYVRNAAVYDTDTEAMPELGDFVPWFLTESDRGYCVHFASAAVILLRCLGVPARYVTGYLVRAEGSGWTEVTEDDAHAWVEYFDDSVASWRLLETTPSAGIPEEEETAPEADRPAAPLPNLRNEPETPDTPDEASPRTEPAVPAQRKRASSLPFLIGIPAAAALFLCLWPLVRSARRKAVLRKADPNEAALMVWRFADRLASRTGAERSDSWKAGQSIAMKARFSPHTVTEEERAALDALLAESEEAVRRDKNLLRRYARRWFWGI